MEIKIALAGNPNCGKTTMFNDLTGSSQYVGNWPGVTVEKKEGKLKDHRDVIIQDLPGIYSLSPYTMEEVVARGYLVNERPDAIINIVDGTNIERNLYLTTQILELGIPVVVAVNMIDLVKKNGDNIYLEKLSKELGCPVVETSALKGEGNMQVAEVAINIAKTHKTGPTPPVFLGNVEHAIAHIEESIAGYTNEQHLRWFAIKLFERDEKAALELKIPKDLLEHIEEHIKDCEKELDDDAESIITNQRYEFVAKVISTSVKKKRPPHYFTTSDKIDRIVTDRFLALPIFALIMFLVYYISMSTVGAFATDFTNDAIFGEFIAGNMHSWMTGIGCQPWLVSLVVEGIIGGVGAVIGFVPQMVVLFFLLSILEDIGYMSRVAFIMDKLFRKFGLSGKSFIPLLVASGCGVPGVMASRTIEQERDRRITIMTACFVPCGAKMPIIALFAGALFGGSGAVATASYFIGIAAVVISGIFLKKTKLFAGDPAPFVMELPAYHMPLPRNILRTTWDRGSEFVMRAGSVILASSIILWFLQSFGFVNGAISMVADNNTSLLASLGKVVAPIFAPLGFGGWKATVATFTGLLAKENVVGTLGVLYGVAEVAEDGAEIWGALANDFTQLTAFSFIIFNLLCAPCFAAMGAIKKEMNSGRWTTIAISYMCIFAYVISLIVYQLGMLFTGNGFGIMTAVAFLLLGMIMYLVCRKNPYEKTNAVDKNEHSASVR